MREFLENALKNNDAGAGRRQRDPLRELPKRFYKAVAVEQLPEGFAVTLDGRQTKTPTKRTVAVPSAALAEQMAREWDAQGDLIDPDHMPHVKLINSAIEGGEEARVPLIDEIAKFCANDLLLYRADTPRELVARQEEIWDDALVRVARQFGVSFQPTVGIIHKEQSSETLERLRASLEDADYLNATALVSITGITGSGLLAIALREKLLDADSAWTAAHVDEDYQIGLWGEDYEAAERRKQRRKEYDAAVNVIAWLRG